MTSTQLRVAAYDVKSAKALWIAEGGIQQVLYRLKTDSDYRDNPTTVAGNLGDGSYSVTVSKNSSTYTMTSTGSMASAAAENIRRQITQTAVVTAGGITSGILADGSNINFDDSTGTVNGDITCHVAVNNYEGMTISGTITEGADKITPALDFNYYKTLAQAAGQYSTSNLTFQNATYTGVWYTTKKATIGDNAIINGTIVCEGTLQFNGRATGVQINPANNYPALATATSISSTGSGSPKIGLQNSTVNGLVFAGNNITFDYLNTTAFNGTILSGNNISLQDGTGITVTYNPDIFNPMTPGLTISGTGSVTVTPQKDWNEIIPAV
jgi:hypothetical protein